MSIIIKNSVQMSKSMLNNSPSKQTYSFPKSQRFQQARKNIQYCDQIYDIPTVRSARAAGIGYGSRRTENSKQITPAPNYYNTDNQSIQEDVKQKKGWTMGVSREKMEMFGITSKSREISPGPGSFIPQSTLSRIAYSIRYLFLLQLLELNDKQNYPGPQDYFQSYILVEPMINCPSQHLKESLSLAQCKGILVSNNNNEQSIKSTVINPDNSSKSFRSNEKSPGPATYNVDFGMNPVGQYYLANFASSKCRSFNKAQARNFSVEENQNIGPGSYILPSEFGIYRAKDAKDQ